MTSAQNSSLFSALELAPRDPILGLNEAFNADPRSTKVNLGVGVYFTDDGKLPVLQAVAKAEKQRSEQVTPRAYLPIDGIAAYDSAVQKLLFGADSALLKNQRVVTVQALGGTGALKIGADFLKRLLPNSAVAISDPSWENHRALFESAGFEVVNYQYYDAALQGLNFDALLASLSALPAHTIVVLHACCHNPTGADPSPEQWQQIVSTVKARGLVPFIDLAYQGFAEGVEADGLVPRLFADSGVSFVVSSSFSKSFSLYGERVGALSIVTQNADESARVLSQVKRVIRTNYSSPPTHGASVVASVLNDPELRAQWEQELGLMRERIKQMRHDLVQGLQAKLPGQDFSFVLKQRGMFSYSGLSAAQVERLKTEFGIYAVSTGRICVAALNSKNIHYVVDAIAAVVKASAPSI